MGQPVTSLEETSLKRQQDALDQIRQLVEDANNWLTFDGLNFAERYIKGQINLAFDFRVTGEGHHHRAFIERIPIGVCRETEGTADIDRNSIARVDRRAEQTGTNAGTHGPYRDNFTVFIGDIEFIEGPQKVIPSRVCLEPPNHIDGIRVELLYFLFDLGFKYLSVFPKGEIDARRARRSIRFREAAGHLIETDAQVMYGVGGNQTNVAWDSSTQLDLNVFADAIRVVLFEHSIGFGLNKGYNNAVQIVNVAFGPFNL